MVLIGDIKSSKYFVPLDSTADSVLLSSRVLRCPTSVYVFGLLKSLLHGLY